MLVMVFTALQFVSFAFTPKTMPNIAKEFHTTIDFLQNMFLFSSASIFDASFILTECCVLLLIVIMLTQEKVEFAKFRSPDSKAAGAALPLALALLAGTAAAAAAAGAARTAAPWKYTWLVMSGFSQTCVAVFRAIDCSKANRARVEL